MLSMNPALSPTPRLRQILLIEAEPMLRLTVTSFLERSGYDVTACADPLDAVRLLGKQSARPAVVLLSTRWLDAAVVRLAHQVRELSPQSPILCIADAVESGEPDKLPLPAG